MFYFARGPAIFNKIYNNMPTENQTPSNTESNLFVDFSARTLKSNLLSYKKKYH